MLNNDKSEISKTLSLIGTKRRIALTGTPLQNNLNEYYRMTNWIRPGCLAPSVAKFEQDYVKIIMSSLMVSLCFFKYICNRNNGSLIVYYLMQSDSSEADQSRGENLLQELYAKLTPFVQRLDSSILESDLEFIQQAVIHVRQTKLQLKLNRAYKNFTTKNGITNFLQRFQELFPVNNHPGCLLIRSLSRQQSGDEKSKKQTTANNQIVKSEYRSSDQSNQDVISLLDSEEEDVFESKQDAPVPAQSNIIPSEKEWWRKVLSKHPNMSDVENGGKVILLLQILVHADTIGDKVLVFTQCLKTLDFIEQVLQTSDWSLHLPSIADLNPGKRYGKWRKNIEYLRIDGNVEAKKRGDLVNKFNDDKKRNESSAVSQEDSKKNVEETAKLFLISSNAGNVGINLIGANRVILFDSSWNPSKDEQSVHRSYRYGQKKPVYVYRLLTEGTKCLSIFI